MSEPYWTDGTVTLHLGDCLDVLAAMEPASVDAVVTDPPYALNFMGKEWDSFAGYVERNGSSRALGDDGGRHDEGYRNMRGKERDYQAWCQQWAAECLRVLKPGGHLLAFGGTRTWHRLACGIEDAGFEIRDSVADLTGREGPGLAWLYGSGFPKSRDVSKAIDAEARAVRTEVTGIKPGHEGFENRTDAHSAGGRSEGWDRRWRDDPGAVARSHQQLAPATEDAARWEGWGTALKPAWEPIVVARKPLAGTVAGNVTEHGTGALNVDGCRVPGDEDGSRNRPPSRLGSASTYAQDEWTRNAVVTRQDTTGQGRWPPNVLLGPDAAAELDRQSGTLTSGANPARRGSDKFRDAYGEFAGQQDCTPARGADAGGASRFFPVFRYEAKAPASERPRGDDGTAHPTVKPVDLMAWLVRLVTRPGGLVLDPFAGSGTTAEACIVEGLRCVLIEKDPAYAALIRKRLRKDIQPAMFGS